MKEITNRFGTENMYEINDLFAVGKNTHIYTACTACMGVWSDMLSYIESVRNTEKDCFTDRISESSHEPITDAIILSCQVTDLSIYNDLKAAEEIHEKYPDITIYIGGCLAQRFDVELPDFVRRLDVVRSEYTPLSDYTLHHTIDYRKPFWNPGLKEEDGEFEDGNLFRHMYPLKTGAGCHGKCRYCTIRDTRGPSYEADAFLQIKEFLDHEDVVLVSDSPTVRQIKDWCLISERYNKPISFRNVEPPVANACGKELQHLAESGLLKIFHCPIQSNIPDVLKAMNRNVNETFRYIELAQELRKAGVFVATNIIIDYRVDGKLYQNPDKAWMKEHFDYYVWNPYFDGNFNMEKAAERFKKYITDCQK